MKKDAIIVKKDEKKKKKIKKPPKMRYEVIWYHPLTGNELCRMKFKSAKELIKHRGITRVAIKQVWIILNLPKDEQINKYNFYVYRL